MANPGFPIGGRAPVRGGMDLQHGHFLVKMYAKTKELGPIGGGVHLARPPRSANAKEAKTKAINDAGNYSLHLEGISEYF